MPGIRVWVVLPRGPGTLSVFPLGVIAKEVNMMMLSFVFLGLLLFGGALVALLAGAAALVRNRGGDTNPSDESQGRTAREVLDQRLARGEISREEYEAIRDQIES